MNPEDVELLRRHYTELPEETESPDETDFLEK
jgi:hypothetical protein